MRRIGFLINPVAGMGGSVGLKGTDGNADEARRRGALPRAQDRAAITLRHLMAVPDLFFVTCSGEMGEAAFRACGETRYRVAYHTRGPALQKTQKKPYPLSFRKVSI